MNARLLTTAVLLSLTAAPAWAADCTSIKDDKERLACFDAAAAAPKKPAEDPIFVKARAAMAAQLKDPPSARFEEMIKKGDVVCGFVNAKNSYGGYTGRAPFIYVIQGAVAHLGIPATQITASNVDQAEIAMKLLRDRCGAKYFPF